ncbi:WD40-repeat-containing domain protein [Suillus bovinus]|uniref:WD40-repeat-containing domain protein n=1 Tax=Suillus bovinus TaxID=48563 RepID=UPI001B86D546|nr:WD40-repeat-containing domain protein [Suillus bovinus]KAG2147811.1 WD40-repeat-containing domain protein [Suillus bovinus]
MRQGNQIDCGRFVHCIRYSPSGEFLAIATESEIKIYDPDAERRVAYLRQSNSTSLAWTPDGTHLFSISGSSTASLDPASILEWDASTWKQVRGYWTAHTGAIHTMIAIDPAGTLLASTSFDNVHLWSLPDRRSIIIFKHSKFILAIDPTIHNVWITGDLTTAEQLLTQEIDVDANSYTSYANRSFVMARKLDWDHDSSKASTLAFLIVSPLTLIVTQSVSIQLSLAGYVSKGIALCGKKQVREAMTEFDLAFTSTNGDSLTTQFLFLIKVEVVRPSHCSMQELAARPNADPLASRVVEAYLRVQLGIIAMDSTLYKEAVDHFTAAVNAGAFFSKSDIHSMYEGFVMLFGWDLKSLWQIANQQRCYALIRGGQFGAALDSYRYMMGMSDEPTKAIFLAWISTLNEEWELRVANENAALATSCCILKEGN